MTIEFEVEGAGAIEATAALFALPEIEGEWETAPSRISHKSIEEAILEVKN